MKVYIPINSNDFNSVFTTLSISPSSFYPIRKYSFKRNSASFLNNNDYFLVGYTKPIFHNFEFDNDLGFPLLLEIDIDNTENESFEINSNIKYILIDKTVFITREFKLLFRSKKEMNETFAKSLKSLETKYFSLAKAKSEIVKEECFVGEIPKLIYPTQSFKLSFESFNKERLLNKIWGVILGSAIASINSTTFEWQEIVNQIRLLNNTLSLYLNKIGESNEYEKVQAKEIILKISRLFENIQNIEEAILLDSNSNVSSEVLNTLKSLKIFNISAFKLLLEGLMASSGVDLPISLKIEKLITAINSKYNSKYPSSYIERVNYAFNNLVESIDLEVLRLRKSNELSTNNIVTFDKLDSVISPNIPSILNEFEAEYLKQTIDFFIQTDTILDIEYFFTNKQEILINLANHFKSNIESFNNDSKERQYLLELLKSFSSLRGVFQISQIENEVLKSLAILFTSGRDFLRFVENNEKEQISNSIIYFSIWGSIYGASIFPKTQTELITNNDTNLRLVISEFNKIVDRFGLFSLKKIASNAQDLLAGVGFTTFTVKNLELHGKRKISSSFDELKDEDYTLLVNFISNIVQYNRKIKLKEIKSANKQLKSEDAIAEIIHKELSQQIIVKIEGKTRYAIFKESDPILFTS